MSYRYRYTGDLPTVFTTLRQGDQTWMPSKGDQIELDDAIAHPLLELMPHQEEPAEPDVESPDTADDKEI